MANVPDARQMLRWLIRDSETPTTGLDAFIGACLQVVDWELRASAMLAVGLFQAWHHLPLVEQLEWHKDARNGPTKLDAEILRVWHAAILGGAPVHRTEPRDHDTMLLYALLNPLEGVDPATHPHRPGYRFVAAVPHWIGDRRPGMPEPNPIRRYTPPNGFWISENPAGHGSFDDVQRTAAEQSRRSGLTVRLPFADEWEAAARGTDARFFPWGAGYQPDAETIASPWGLQGLMADHGEWTTAPSGECILSGSRDFGLAARAANVAPRPAPFRFVLDDQFTSA